MSTRKKASTKRSAAIAAMITGPLEFVSLRRRNPAIPTIEKMASATALPMSAICDRSKNNDSPSTIATEIARPRVPNTGAVPPKNDGNWRESARLAVRFCAANELALTDDDVASRAAIDIIVKPAAPSDGRAASASAVSP